MMKCKEVTISLMLLLCLSTMFAAQDNKTQSTQASPLNADSTRNANRKLPPPDANCTPGILTVSSGFSSGGGNGTAEFTFSGPLCGSPIPTSLAGWITFRNDLRNCSVNGLSSDCTVPFIVAQNTGGTRSASVAVSFGSSGSLSATVVQFGPPETLTVGVTGGGKVTSSPSGVSCPGTCTVAFTYGTTVTLTASANAGYTFAGWSGACSGTGG